MVSRIAIGVLWLGLPAGAFAAPSVVQPYKDALKKIEQQYKTTCDGLPGASETRAEMASAIMDQLDNTLDQLNIDVAALRQQATAPPPTEKSEAAKRLPDEIKKAEAGLQSEVDKLQRLAFDRSYRASTGVKIDEQRQR